MELAVLADAAKVVKRFQQMALFSGEVHVQVRGDRHIYRGPASKQWAGIAA
jgi:hypothetical protein